jgi:hypothetical protein
MNPKQLVIGILVILLVSGIFGVSTSATAANDASSPVVRDLSLVELTWQQVNSSGFGDPQTSEVTALGAFNGYLYAGNHNPIDPELLFDGAQIFRSSDGIIWNPITQPGFGIAHDIAPPAILDFLVFNTRLYASTGRGDGPGQIWRSLDGINWAPMIIHGFNDQDNVDVTALSAYNGVIYAGVTNLVSGAQIWSSFTGDSNTWTQASTPSVAEASITGFANFDGGLYAAVESPGAAHIWRSYGAAWTSVVNDGFGDGNTTLTGGLAVFAGDLYVGAGNSETGAQLWRTSDGEIWTPAIPPAFGDPNNLKVEQVFVFQNQLYVSVKNTVTGLEVWRTADGSNWEQANLDGFNDSNNTGTNWSNATENFLNQLYVGTSNVTDGGELWRTNQPYGVDLSPDDALSGPVGQTVTYTLEISNTGSLADSFDLTATGQTWTSTLSTSIINLAPSASVDFTVTVAIPPGAADQETDTVTITATSQGDSSKTDSALLTTTGITEPIYGVALSGDHSLSGPAGEQVVYTIVITNTGDVVDTFDLLPTGNIWTTILPSQVVTLAAGDSQAVMITVSIPLSAAAMDSDQVTLLAVSQHDVSAQDTTILTTVSTGLAVRLYLPAITRN